jgi:hypothetical protein
VDLLKRLVEFSIVVIALAAAAPVFAAQLSTDARGAVPREVQQLVVIDYRAMQNSTAAMDLRNRVMPPELKQFDEALANSGLNENHDVDELAFALFRPSERSDALQTVGIAQGQFDTQGILANFRKQKLKATMLRANSIYPMTKTGMMLCFVNPSTLIFGSKEAVTKALDARDGMTPSMLTNGPMMNAMQSVDWNPLWSILDDKGTQTMMRQILGEAGSVTDFESVRKRLEASWYSMDFQHGVQFNLTIATGERLRCGKAGVELDRHRIELREPYDSLCQLRCGVPQPVAIASVQEHGALRVSAVSCGSGSICAHTFHKK